MKTSRLFLAIIALAIVATVVAFDEMCYCLDSYLGLGYDYIDDNLYFNERPVCWTVDTIVAPPDINRWYTYGHQLYVEYGCPTNGIGPID